MIELRTLAALVLSRFSLAEITALVERGGLHWDFWSIPEYQDMASAFLEAHDAGKDLIECAAAAVAAVDENFAQGVIYGPHGLLGDAGAAYTGDTPIVAMREEYSGMVPSKDDWKSFLARGRFAAIRREAMQA